MKVEIDKDKLDYLINTEKAYDELLEIIYEKFMYPHLMRQIKEEKRENKKCL